MSTDIPLSPLNEQQALRNKTRAYASVISKSIKSAKQAMPIVYKASYSSGVYGSYCSHVEQPPTPSKSEPVVRPPPISEEVKENKKGDKDLQRFPIQVFVRMRPLVGLEITEKQPTVKYGVKKVKKKKRKTQSLTLKKVHGRNLDRDKAFAGFTKILTPQHDNRVTFDECLLPTCIPYIFNGDHCCVFAYGHTGSGKTHTIFGYAKENVAGMYQLFARHLMKDERLNSVSNDTFIEIRFTELYQGKIRDLLSADKAECHLREDKKNNFLLRAPPKKCEDGKIRQYPITAVHVQNEQELMETIADGIASRNVGKSTLHDKSSRSHAFLEFELVCTELMNARKQLVEEEAEILSLTMMMDCDSMATLKQKFTDKGLPIPEAKLKMANMVEGLRNGRGYVEIRNALDHAKKQEKQLKKKMKALCNDAKRPFIGGSVVFVDLAGNEYGRDVKSVDPQEERERNEINKSLLALKECIRGLHNNKTHIVYRNSKLTMYLKRYLSGKESKAIMISNIGSSQKYAKQTVNTLQYSTLVAKA
eukprot:161999_1